MTEIVHSHISNSIMSKSSFFVGVSAPAVSMKTKFLLASLGPTIDIPLVDINRSVGKWVLQRSSFFVGVSAPAVSMKIKFLLASLGPTIDIPLVDINRPVADAVMDVDENINSNDHMSDYDEQEQNSEEQEDANDDDCDDEDDDDDTTDQDKKSDDDTLYEITYQQQEAMEKLSNLFRMLNSSPIHDHSNVVPIRRQVDQVYTNLQQMCDVLEGQMDKSIQTNPHELRVEESYELITGLKKLFNESSPAEQVDHCPEKLRS
ncbi:unnamed protein product [Didymodactylos carnosus]|uniref:Uncharacterized protein n=1 Tax=Didymodactylos carnosus TaxID=1234261 RepID=A0A814UCG9_9BILA|nr:unnamed protein product [Didymodactylos carnosus]CAF3936918.1 unnamed protein product [Didymodactylos carnosus]